MRLSVRQVVVCKPQKRATELISALSVPHTPPLMADSKQGAYSSKATDTDFRRKWDKEEYAERARKKDEEERLRMQENEERMKQGTSLSLFNVSPKLTT